MSRPVLHLISQAHLDPVWLWPQRDGVAEALTTMQSAVDRAAENPDFCFSRSSSCTYEWVKAMDPVLYQSISELVEAGRWEVVGGWVEQPDCNLPSAESFLRQGLYGKAFFEREFGEKGRTHIGYNPDSFGHCGGLPQLLEHSDFDAYAFMRPQPWDMAELPLLFWWESENGSRVLGCRIPECYSQSYATSNAELEALIREAPEKNFMPGLEHGVLWFGVGNHGGGPTREHIALVKELQLDPDLPELRFSTLRDFLAEVRQSPQAENFPVIRKELGYLLRGCYSATGEVKQLHRFSEQALFSAELMSVISQREHADPQELNAAWWKLLFNQFHDILAGTCVPSAQAETRHRFGSTLDACSELKLRSTCQLARRVDTRAEKGSVLFAANPLPWSRKALVQLDTFMEPHGREEITGLELEDGRPVPLQWASADANFGPWGLKWGKLSALLELPAGGYRCFRVKTRPIERQEELPEEGIDESNRQFTRGGADAGKDVVTTQDPVLPSLKHEEVGELLQQALGCVVIKDDQNTWGFQVEKYDEVLGRPELLESEILEEGELFRSLRQKSRWGDSEIWMDVTHYAHTEDVDVTFRVNWQEQRKILKLELDTRLQQTRSLARMPAEVVTRNADGCEYPCHDWVILEGQLDGEAAQLALLNDSSYSYDAEEGRLRMILVRAVAHAEHPPFEYKDDRNIPFLDQGWQERRFRIRVGRKLSPVELDRCAREFQVPAEHMLDSGHPGSEAWEASLVELERGSVELLALKAAEHGDGWVLRLRENSGKATQVSMRVHGRRLNLDLNAFELVTLKLPTDLNEKVIRLNALEQAIGD